MAACMANARSVPSAEEMVSAWSSTNVRRSVERQGLPWSSADACALVVSVVNACSCPKRSWALHIRWCVVRTESSKTSPSARTSNSQSSRSKEVPVHPLRRIELSGDSASAGGAVVTTTTNAKNANAITTDTFSPSGRRK
jgi:hypothetical protein